MQTEDQFRGGLRAGSQLNLRARANLTVHSRINDSLSPKLQAVVRPDGVHPESSDAILAAKSNLPTAEPATAESTTARDLTTTHTPNSTSEVLGLATGGW